MSETAVSTQGEGTTVQPGNIGNIAQLSRNINIYLVFSDGTTTRTLVARQILSHNHGTAVAFRSIVMAILVRRWRLVTRSKAHDLRRQFRWSAADRADNTVANMAIPLAPSNPCRDSIVPAGANQKPPYQLI